MSASGLQYLLITPAKNEEAFIELTIRSVVDQTVRPVCWLVVSDGSTDSTNEIVSRAAQQYDWIELFKMPERTTRDFGGKAHCFNTGYARIAHLPHQVVPIMFQALARCFDVNVLKLSEATFRQKVAESTLSPCLRRGFEVGIRAPLPRK